MGIYPDFKRLSGQSAIEYLMTYGWMLLVVAVVGGAIFSVVQSQSVESVSGFSGGDVTVDDFGVTSDGDLQLILRNSAGESVEVTGIEVSGNGNTAEWSDTKSIGVGNTESVTLNSVEEGDGASSLDVEVFYDIGGLENLGVSGTISGNFEVVSDSINYGLSADYSVNDSSPEPGDAVEFSSSSSPVSEISSYSWSSPDTTLDESSGESIVHVFGSEGSYEVNLTVADGLGNESSYSEIIDVSSSSGSADFQLSAVSDNGPVTEGDNVNIDYSVSNNGGEAGTQDITLTIDGTQEDVDSSVSLGGEDSTTGVLSWSTSGGDAGSYGYMVSSENSSESGSVAVDDLEGPTAVISTNITDNNASVGDEIEFDASGSAEGDASIESYDWDFNDSTMDSGETVTHSYSGSGNYIVKLTVEDSNGETNMAVLEVKVETVEPESGVSRWTFNDKDTEGDTSLDIWGDNDGDIVGATTGTAGKSKEAYSFDGSDDRVEFQEIGIFGGDEEFSLSAWFKSDNDHTGAIISTQGEDYWDLRVSGGMLEFLAYDGSAHKASVSYANNEWIHVVATYNPDNGLTLYKNGTEQDTDSFTGTPNSESDVNAIGTHGATSRFFDGKIDNPQIYNKELSSAEISNLYENNSIN